MELQVAEAPEGVVVVDVAGSVDVYTAAELRSGLDGQIQRGRIRLAQLSIRGELLDDVDFLDSTGLGVLVARLKVVRSQNGWLKLVCTSEKVLRVFRITGLDKVFAIHATVDDALGIVEQQVEGA